MRELNPLWSVVPLAIFIFWYSDCCVSWSLLKFSSWLLRDMYPLNHVGTCPKFEEKVGAFFRGDLSKWCFICFPQDWLWQKTSNSHLFADRIQPQKPKRLFFWGRIPGLWRVHSSHPFLKPHTWLICVEFTIWLQFCSQCQFPPTNHKSLIYHLLTELGLEGGNDRGSLTRHTGGQAIGHGGHLAQRAIAWMSLLSPQDAHYTRLTTKAWLTLGNMITRMKRSDEAWVDHGQRFLLRSTTSPNQRKGILWWIKSQ